MLAWELPRLQVHGFSTYSVSGGTSEGWKREKEDARSGASAKLCTLHTHGPPRAGHFPTQQRPFPDSESAPGGSQKKEHQALLQTSLAVSLTSANFSHIRSIVISLPPASEELEKPHCGEIARKSNASSAETRCPLATCSAP